MKTIEECLDIILMQLHKDWDKPGEDRDFLKAEELLKRFELTDLYHKHEFFKRLIDRLVKDGYAEHIHKGIDEWSMDFYQQCTLITIEGFYFITEGGYVKEKANRDAKKRSDNVHIWVLSIGAGLAGVYSLIQIATDVFGSKKEVEAKYIVLPQEGSQTNEAQLKTIPYPDSTYAEKGAKK